MFTKKLLEFETGKMRLVPEGNFPMGSNEPDANSNEKPEHEVFVNNFFMDTYMVTNRQFLQFCNETKYKTIAEQTGIGDTYVNGKWKWVKGANWRHPFGPEAAIDENLSHPVVLISIIDAIEYCKWRSKKEGCFFRLPTEAEWEKAARGTDKRKYPWGNTPPEDNHKNLANYNSSSAQSLLPVNSFPEGSSPYNIHGLAGNAWEWCLDTYDAEFYRKAPKIDNGGPWSTSVQSVFRGGSFIFPKEALSSTGRHLNNLSRPSVGIGFRTVIPSKKWGPTRLRVYNRKMVHCFQMFKRKIKRKLQPDSDQV